MNKVAILSLGVACALVGASAQAAQRSAPKPLANVPMVQDWSSNQAAFRNPETPEQAAKRGAEHYKRWQRLAADPRFMLQLNNKLERQAFGSAPSLVPKSAALQLPKNISPNGRIIVPMEKP